MPKRKIASDATSKSAPAKKLRGKSVAQRKNIVNHIPQVAIDNARKNTLQTILSATTSKKEIRAAAGIGEFQTANVEMISSNEVLQSINKKIGTTKEDLQSTNEELTTLNGELQLRARELAMVNSDLNNVISSVSVPIVIVDNKLIIRRVTPITKKSFQITSKDIGRSISEIKFPKKFPNLGKVVFDVIAEAHPYHLEIVDEQSNWYTLWVRPYRTLENKIDGAIITFVDINEVKIAQLEHQRAVKYAEGIIETMREPLVVLDKKFIIRNTNVAFAKLFNIEPHTLSGVSFLDVAKKEWDKPEVHSLLTKVLQKRNTHENFEIESHFPHRGNMTLLVNAHQLIQSGPNEEFILLVMSNITERKFMQQRTDTFMSMASHELKTPATTIKMLAELLQKRFVESEDKMLIQYLRKISEQVDHLAKISTDLLDVSGIRSGKFAITEGVFDLGILASEVIDDCQLLAEFHKIVLRGAKSIMVHGDRERIGRVIINLITNATKYSSRGSEVIVTITHKTSGAVVAVKDFGIGIKSVDQKKIFEHSTQVALEKGQHSTGLGLGLYISSTIIERHSGRIWVESKIRKGSTFFFSLPSKINKAKSAKK